MPQCLVMPQRLQTALLTATAVSAAGALAGYAALLRCRKNEPISNRDIAGACLNSGLMAFAICMMMFHYYPDAIFLNIGLSVSSGLGGNTALGIFIRIWSNLASSILKVQPDDISSQNLQASEGSRDISSYERGQSSVVDSNGSHSVDND